MVVMYKRRKGGCTNGRHGLCVVDTKRERVLEKNNTKEKENERQILTTMILPETSTIQFYI